MKLDLFLSTSAFYNPFKDLDSYTLLKKKIVVQASIKLRLYYAL